MSHIEQAASRPLIQCSGEPLPNENRQPTRLLLAAMIAPLLCLLGPPTMAKAQTETVGVQPVAVQNRQHVHRHEFSGFVGVLPLDAFTKGLTASASYTLHFDPLRAWEVVHFGYSFPFDTHLRDDLEALDIAPTTFEVLRLFVTSNFIYKPVYWKGALHNRRLLHGEIFLAGGGGWGLMTRSGRPALDAGLGMRLFASEQVSFRMDIRAISLFAYTHEHRDLQLHNELWLGLGISL